MTAREQDDIKANDVRRGAQCACHQSLPDTTGQLVMLPQHRAHIQWRQYQGTLVFQYGNARMSVMKYNVDEGQGFDKGYGIIKEVVGLRGFVMLYDSKRAMGIRMAKRIRDRFFVDKSNRSKVNNALR